MRERYVVCQHLLSNSSPHLDNYLTASQNFITQPLHLPTAHLIYLALSPAKASGLCLPLPPIPTKSTLSLLTCLTPCGAIVGSGGVDMKGLVPPAWGCIGIVTLRCTRAGCCSGIGCVFGSSGNVCSGRCGARCGMLYRARMEDLSCLIG